MFKLGNLGNFFTWKKWVNGLVCKPASYNLDNLRAKRIKLINSWLNGLAYFLVLTCTS